SNDDMAVTVSHLALLLKRDDLGYQSFTVKQVIDHICQLLQERAELQEQVERLQESCESAVVEIDRLRRERDEVHQAANPALLGALERAGADPVGFGDAR